MTLTDDPLILDTDVSETSIGAELSQVQNGQEVVFSYASNILMHEQKRLCTTQNELLAVVKFIRQFCHYLLGYRFLLRTNHNCLVWLISFRNPEGQLARWLEELSQFDFQIVHRQGKKHGNADGLSQIPLSELPCDCYTAGAKLESLPCYPCHYCAKVHSQWERFKEDVDDVVPLAIKNLVSSVRHIQPEDDVDKNSELDSTNLSQSTDNPVNVDVEITPEPKVDSDVISNSNFMAQYSSQELRDSNLKAIIRWLSQGTKLIPQELYLQSPAVKHLWLCKDQLQFQDNILFYR